MKSEEDKSVSAKSDQHWTEMEHAPMPVHITDFNRFMSFQSILVHLKQSLE